MNAARTMTIDTVTLETPAKAKPGPTTRPTPKKTPSPTKADRLPPFHVMLHNDNHHDMMEVVDSIVLATPVQKKSAAIIMLAAHFKGRAIVLTTHKERAEFYRDRLRSCGLIATIEPAP